MTGVMWCAVYVCVQRVAGWNATPLVSGNSQKAVALGLFYIPLVVESVPWIVFKRTFQQFLVLRTFIMTFYLNLFQLMYNLL